MAITDWISLTLTATLVIATGYYAREVRRQSKQILRRERRPKVVDLVDQTLLSIKALLEGRPDISDITEVLSTPDGDESGEVTSSAFVDIEPIELSASHHTSLITNQDITGDLINLINQYNKNIDNVSDSVDQSIARLYLEGNQTRGADVLRYIDAPVWDELIQIATGEEINISPANLPEGVEVEDFTFFNFIIRIIEHRMNETTSTNDFIIDNWIDFIGAIENAEPGTDAAKLSYIIDVDSGLTDLAEDLDQIYKTQRKLNSEIEECTLSLINKYSIRPSEIENTEQMHHLYGG